LLAEMLIRYWEVKLYICHQSVWRLSGELSGEFSEGEGAKLCFRNLSVGNLL
jgi:hypothetical protein